MVNNKTDNLDDHRDAVSYFDSPRNIKIYSSYRKQIKDNGYIQLNACLMTGEVQFQYIMHIDVTRHFLKGG